MFLLGMRMPFLRHYPRALHATLAIASCNNLHFKCRFYSQQKALPHLPVPPLNQTVKKYLQTITPVVTVEQFNITKGLVDSFTAANGYGEHLQSKLLQHACTQENWLSQWWLEYAYLESRTPVVIYYSPSVSFPKYEFSGTQGQIKHAAKVIAAVLNYKVFLDVETLPADKMGKASLCMNQYYKMLSSCRIPGLTRDEVYSYSKAWKPPRHITVIHNNRFFELEVYHQDDSPLTIHELEMQLDKIVVSSLDSAAYAVGILTTMDRDSWCKAYVELAQDNENLTSLKSIQRSIFTLCLDQYTPEVADEQWRSDMTGRLLHGGGSKWNTGNRWFDKTIQMIVDKNGGVGLLYEHSTAEGPPVVALADYVYENCENPNSEPYSCNRTLLAPKELKFNVSKQIACDINVANDKIDNLIEKLTLKVFEFSDFGKEFVKSVKLSPDSFIQVALQLAYHRIHKQPPVTYESASLRQFHLGRTDTIRSATVESHAFTIAMAKKLPVKELQQELRNAVLSHKNYVKDAVSGQAIDRHLLGLRLIAKKTGQEEPDLFQDSAYQRAMHFNLSTSQVPCKADLSMGFSPAVDDGYGICYNPKNDKIVFSISSWNTLPQYNADNYHEELVKALQEMKSILS